jgi:subtilisin family serine protease
VAALLVLAMAALPGSAVAMRGSGELSPRLAKLAGASLRGAAPAVQARALGLAPDGLARQGQRLLVDVRFDGGALAARDELREAGARIVAVSRRYQAVTVATSPARLREIAAEPGVEGVTPVLAPVATAECPSGAVVSEGDEQLKALEARETKGVDGTGVTVGILSDSFDQATEDEDGEPIATKAADDVKSADLPGTENECGHTTPVAVLSEQSNAAGASDEGRAMAQIVHDLAPGANLEFASAFNGEISFANNIRALATAGAEVIADDVFYPGEPFFQDGPIAVAVREVVEDGATYFSAAGNNNLIEEDEDEERHDIASWETPGYRDAGSCPPAIQAIPGAKATHCLDFNPGSAVDRTFGIKVKPGATLALDLQWDEPWNGVATDLDAFLLDLAGNRIPGAESQEDNVGISQTPVEVLEWPNSSGSTKTVQLVVNRFSEGGTPAVKFALIQNGGGVSATEYPRSSGEDVVGPTIFGHSGTAAAISTGAVYFGDKSDLETYSSRGPVRHDFGPVEGTSPAPLLGASEELSKPDLVATDCGKTTFFSFFVFNDWHFCGTSAAAPHAAAVAALMLDAEPAAEPDDVRGALVASAAEVGTFGSCDAGAGLVEAVGAIEEALAKTGASGPLCEPPESEVDPSEAAAPGNWGSEVPPPPTGGGGSPPPPPTPQPDPEEPKPVFPPRTFFLQRPAKVIRTQTRGARAVFLFGSDKEGVSFVCRIDGGLFRPCSERLARRFPLGWHTVKVAALDAEGNGDKTPASYRFKIKKVR